MSASVDGAIRLGRIFRTTPANSQTENLAAWAKAARLRNERRIKQGPLGHVVDRLQAGIRVGLDSTVSQRGEDLRKAGVRKIVQLTRFGDFAAMPEYAPDAAVIVQRRWKLLLEPDRVRNFCGRPGIHALRRAAIRMAKLENQSLMS